MIVGKWDYLDLSRMQQIFQRQYWFSPQSRHQYDEGLHQRGRAYRDSRGGVDFSQ
jgi:hypothetical protein